MPKERFSNEQIAKFFDHKHGTPTKDRHRGNNRQWELTSSRGYPAKRIRVAYDFWYEIIRLVERHGYRCPSDNTGLAGNTSGFLVTDLARRSPKRSWTTLFAKRRPRCSISFAGQAFTDLRCRVSGLEQER